MNKKGFGFMDALIVVFAILFIAVIGYILGLFGINLIQLPSGVQAQNLTTNETTQSGFGLFCLGDFCLIGGG